MGDRLGAKYAPTFHNADALAKHLGLSAEFVVSCLTKLKELGIVRQDGKSWHAQAAHLHAPRGSIFHWLHLSNWRQRALLNAQNENESLHYTGIHSLSRADAQSLQFSLLKFIRDSNASIALSPEELGVCVNIDFFEF